MDETADIPLGELAAVPLEELARMLALDLPVPETQPGRFQSSV
jgi:hypothetical protein